MTDNSTLQQAPPRNGLGTAGFVLGLLGLVVAPIPLAGVVAWPLAVAGLILSAVGLARVRAGKATNRGLTIAGIVVSVLGLVVSVLWGVVIGKAVSDVQDQATQHHTITYEVSGDAKAVNIDYSTFEAHTILINTELSAPVPWTKTVEATGFLEGAQFTATAGPDGGSVTCKVVVDGKDAKTATAAGPGAVASCTGF
ncbi:MmpS family transport accessory protein [Amycolatopsis sp., V23-08]|uniref:MmpS family transport accessory protein n=1 Tax=Amycolatopsis heterodermiae TaxID=3110235 RepID=A0ABU5RBB4_9PSEU|nr:MmpS family transport accessory protein [Amycolatopsis sp., V23-08]MEA5363059.1 MmpS family transport accessory protein [Amycolatopsis sp., V23-08]